jgi:hypothetical protein
VEARDLGLFTNAMRTGSRQIGLKIHTDSCPKKASILSSTDVANCMKTAWRAYLDGILGSITILSSSASEISVSLELK